MDIQTLRRELRKAAEIAKPAYTGQEAIIVILALLILKRANDR